MSGGRIGGLWEVLAWMAFPAVPVVLENIYYGLFLWSPSGYPDPRDWNWLLWLIELGPLTGFALLAGLTLDLPDEPGGRRGPRAWLSRRWLWVAVGPWSGVAMFWVVAWVCERIAPYWPDTPPSPARVWLVGALSVATVGYGWLIFAVAAIRRARRLGRARAAIRRGLGFAAAFLGSLFGGFWALTEWFRGYFFDPRVFPVILVVAASGCSATVTYGEVRRRELFRAMLLAWTMGLALMWRWWARSGKPPR